jgi:hypothetical protein
MLLFTVYNTAKKLEYHMGPGRPKKTVIVEVAAMSIRLPIPLRDRIGELAEASHRSLNQEIVWLIEKAFETLDREKAKANQEQPD